MTKLHRFLMLAFAGWALASCSATNPLSMTVTEPAQVALPNQVRRVGIVNRSVPSEGRQGLDKVEAILSAEGLKLDQQGASAAMAGLADRLRLSNRFEAVVVLDSLPQVAKGTKAMPASLSRDQVSQLCEAYGLDAVFSLAYFDTDTRVAVSLGVMEVPNQLGVRIQVPAHAVDLETLVANGWRIYLPDLPLPLDEMQYSDVIRVSGKGISPLEAIESIANRKERILERSRETGYFHGGRLEATRVRVGRDYFVRGTDRFARGMRLARTGDWDAAAVLWEQETSNPKEKIAGRAHYNMAVINEINGNLDAAIEWARQAYAEYGNREALRYLRILQNRRAQQELLMAEINW